MENKRTSTAKTWIKDWLTPSLLFGFIVMGAWVGGQYKKDSENRMFQDAKQKEKTRAHIDSDYNEVKNYQLMLEQKQMKLELDTAYAWVNAVFKEDREARELESKNLEDAIKSRHRRDSVVKATMEAQKRSDSIANVRYEEIQREQRITSNAVQLILSKLDTIN